MSRSQHDDALISYRCWRFSSRTGLLTSTVRGTEWTPCERLEAICLRGTSGLRPKNRAHWVDDGPCEHAPSEECTCGIYAWLDPADMRRLVRVEPHTIPVWGKCSMWGDVAFHTRGVRAQYAYPYELFIGEQHADLAKRVRSIYRVDVVTV